MAHQGGQLFKYLTWSNIVNKFAISLPTYIRFTRSTPLLRRSSDILKTNILFLDCPRNLLPWMYLKLE